MSSHSFELDRVPNKRDWAPILVTIIIAGLSLVVSGLTAYSKNDTALSNRVSVVETQQRADDGRLDRIEHTVDSMNTKIDRLLERR
jgi:hypothetical protein